MKLDDKCTRAVLEAVEAASTYYDSFSYTPDSKPPEQLRKYTHDQIVYHIHYCNESGYLEGCSILGNGGMVAVNDLSKAGHEYLKAVRSRSLWGSIKSTIKDEGRDGLRSLIRSIVTAIAKWFNPFA